MNAPYAAIWLVLAVGGAIGQVWLMARAHGTLVDLDRRGVIAMVARANLRGAGVRLVAFLLGACLGAYALVPNHPDLPAALRVVLVVLLGCFAVNGYLDILLWRRVEAGFRLQMDLDDDDDDAAMLLRLYQRALLREAGGPQPAQGDVSSEPDAPRAR